MIQKLENVCPVDQQINNDDRPFWLFIDERKISEQVAKMMSEKNILGRIIISTNVCAIFITCSLKNILQTSSTTYKFHTED